MHVALMSDLSLGHFGTSAKVSGQFGPTKIVLKYLGSEVSGYLNIDRSPRDIFGDALPLIHSKLMHVRVLQN